MSASPKAYYRARPVRVAFFIDDHEHSNAMLEAIFKSCMGRWGGRFNLLIPTTSAGPKENYLNWLQAYDPDIIYSYVDLDDAAIEQLQERFYPSFLIRHDFYRRTERDAHAYYPKLPFDCLKITSLIPMATLPTIFDGSRNGRFLEAMGSLQNTPFVRDSFGFFTECAGHGFFATLNEFGNTVTLVADADCQPRERYIRQPNETVSDVVSLINFATNKSLITMSQLSSMVTPRLDINNHRWGNTFNIVVGDTFTDRVVYWNTRSLYPKWRDRGYVDLRIPRAYLSDANILDALSKFIRARNQVTGHSNSTPYATVRSSSVPLDELNSLVTALKGNSSWVVFNTETFSTIDECIPSAEELERADYVVAENFMARAAAQWSETPADSEQLVVNPPAPKPLKYCPAHFQSANEGAWAIDVEIDRKLDYSLVSNVQQKWQLPRRLRITRALISGHQIAGNSSAFVMPRVSNGGLLTVYANVATTPIPIKLPDDEDAIATAFLQGRDWWPFVRTAGEQMPNQLLRDIRRSENGRYFAGTLGIFGTLNEASDILLHSFWRDQFEKLGASPRQTENTRSVVEAALTNRFRAGVEFPRDKTKLANIILQQADQYRTSIPCRSWNDFLQDFTLIQDRHWQAHPPQGGMTTEHEEMRENETRLFKRGVQDLCEKGILYQGYEHRCSKCLHRSWFAIDNLGPQIKCEVCRREEPAPVDRPWQFRLNEFVREALRKHGVWPLFWALSKMRNFRESSFYFAGPLDVYTTGTRWDRATGDTDIDLTVITNGLVRMCEVKQSIRQLDSNTITNFAQLMLKLRPDIATVAVMEAETPNLRTLFTTFSQALNGSGIKPELLSLSDADFDDSPSFYGITRVRLM